MQGFDTCWAYLLHLFNFVTLNPWSAPDSLQTPVLSGPPQFKQHDHPIFEPPNAPEDRVFVCNYPELPDYEYCSEHDNRGCWLRPKQGSHGLIEYNIHTDYESYFPKGIKRKYTLDVTNMVLYPDGCKNAECKVFNNTYPGPPIEACWGDEIEVTVTNHLDCNGTTIHWHGIRQWNTVENDGVNAVTQCPIAPNDSFTYKFRAMQYGSSWYHSHYSLQYADGVVGPLIIHGPSSGNYDSAKDPILITDWNQRSAFQDWPASFFKGPPTMTSILLNGKGKFVPEPGDSCHPDPPKPYTMVFQKGVRYLLRLINTSVDSTFIFSIDGHNLTVIEMDFVPIEPYTNTSVLIGIGQRYNVIVEASPSQHAPGENYWIRTVPAKGCGTFKQKYTTTTGIVRYNASSESDPVSQANKFDIKCSDETYTSLKPIVPWQVPKPTISETLLVEIVFTFPPPYYPPFLPRFKLYKGPLWLNFSAPTVLNLAATTPPNHDAELKVITPALSNDSWVELLILSKPPPLKWRPGIFPAIAHPIHLHGHDFAILAQSEQRYDPAKVKIKRDNPPRRDVALLPMSGYLIIAFKADNPGVWLMHCHIAWHASSGLALQILENTDRMVLHSRTALDTTCKNWDNWYKGRNKSNCSIYIPFQDDSGI